MQVCIYYFVICVSPIGVMAHMHTHPHTHTYAVIVIVCGGWWPSRGRRGFAALLSVDRRAGVALMWRCIIRKGASLLCRAGAGAATTRHAPLGPFTDTGRRHRTMGFEIIHILLLLLKYLFVRFFVTFLKYIKYTYKYHMYRISMNFEIKILLYY